MTDMEEVIEKALQCVPMVDASQARIREIQAQKIAQAITASGYGGFEVVLAAISQESDKSEDTQRSEASQPALPGELVEAVREMISADFEVQLNGLRKDGSTQPSSAAWRRFRRAVVRIQAALASLPDPLPTVESVRAAARAEYEAELREASTKWHEAARSIHEGGE